MHPTHPIALFQDQPRDHPAGRDDVHPVPAVASQRRGSAARARDQGRPVAKPYSLGPNTSRRRLSEILAHKQGLIHACENGGAIVGHGSGGMIRLRAAYKSSTLALSGDIEGERIFTVDLYRKVRLACPEGMSQREAARRFGILRDSVRKMLSFSVPPGYRRKPPVRRPKPDGFTGIIDAWLEADRGVHLPFGNLKSADDQFGNPQTSTGPRISTPTQRKTPGLADGGRPMGVAAPVSRTSA